MTMKPRDATTFDEVCQLENDNITAGNFWMLVEDDAVTMVKQPSEEQPKAAVTIPREVFNLFVDWYNTGEVNDNLLVE